MNPNKCPLPSPQTTTVYRTNQDVIDHVINPAIRGADLNPIHYNITAFVNDWVVLVDSPALHGYFNTAPDIPGIIDNYFTATKARDLKVGDVVDTLSGRKTVVATSGEFLYGNENCVVIVLRSDSSTYPTTCTVEANSVYELYED